MSKFIRAFFLSVTIMAIMLFSAYGTTTVYADDGTPPPTPEAGTTPEPGTGTDPGTTEVVPVVVEVVPPVETVVTDVTTGPILDQVPENITVTVLNAAGEAQPLASQASADAIAATTDPIWCPATQTTPTPGANGCTGSYTSFDQLLSFLLAHEGDPAYQQAGTIYIEQGAYAGGEASVDFNNYGFTNFNTHDLTLQGGWDPADSSTDSTSQFTAPIIIGSSLNPWVGSLTLNNLSISGVTGEPGLTLFTQGDITISNVDVTNSQTGAELTAAGDITVKDSNFNNNTNAGATLNAGGKVGITNAQFNNNGSGTIDDPTGYGVNIESGGAVSLASVSANNNQLFGANVQAVGNVVVTNGFFNSNQGYAYLGGWVYDGYGLQVITTQNISLDGVQANDNYLFGANLEGAVVEVLNSSFNDNSIDDDGNPIAYGLQVLSSSTVKLDGIEANNNQVYGANIDAQSTVLVTDSFFNGNQSYYWWGDKTYYGYGLQVVTLADIGIDNVRAENNNLLGAHMEGTDIGVSNSVFSNNGSGSALDLVGGGLEVVSTDTLSGVSLSNVIADNNQLFGANIKADGDVAIGGISSFSGHLSYVFDSFTHEISARVGGYGLQVVTTAGNIALGGVTANDNYLYGASLQGVDIAIADSFFSHNGSGLITQPTGYGLKVDSAGTVALINVEANNNQLYGADITAVGNVDIGAGLGKISSFTGNQSISFTPGQGLTFYGYGLNVYTTLGDITLNQVEANFNNLWGAQLDGMNIFVTNSKFNNNISDSNIFIDDTGLLVNSRGAFVLLDNVEAKENRLIGADIRAVGDVYIFNSNFNDNRGFTCSLNWCPAGSITYHGYGLQVTTPGLIQVTGTNASNNNLFGASLNGALVTVENSTFNNNGMGNGLSINASDNVTLTNVSAVNNGGNGVDVTGVCEKLVQANGGIFTDNALYGISVIDATLNLDGAQIFANNASGNIFTDTSACPVVVVLTTSNNSNPSTTDVSTTNNSNPFNTSVGTTNNSNKTNLSTGNSDDTKIKKNSKNVKTTKNGNNVKTKKNGNNTKTTKNDKPGYLKQRVVMRVFGQK